MSEEEKKAIKILQEEHDVMINPKLEAKYTSDEVIEALYIVIMLIRKQQKEIEEKTTIIMAGAEKVKQLEKEIQRLEKDNDTLSELVIVNEDKVIKELDLISKDKIREKIEELESLSKNITMQPSIYNYEIDLLKELLEEN